MGPGNRTESLQQSRLREAGRFCFVTKCAWRPSLIVTSSLIGRAVVIAAHERKIASSLVGGSIIVSSPGSSGSISRTLVRRAIVIGRISPGAAIPATLASMIVSAASLMLSPAAVTSAAVTAVAVMSRSAFGHGLLPRKLREIALPCAGYRHDCQHGGECNSSDADCGI